MTNEEAKCIIQDMLDDAEKYGDIDYDDLNGFISACQIAIKTLSDVPDTNVGDMISRQALRDAMYHEAFETDTEMQRWDSGCWIRYRLFEKVLKEAPTVEPEWKTGKWIHDGYDHPHGVDWMHCSECGKRDVFCLNTMTNFCPHCGAKMEGEEDD